MSGNSAMQLVTERGWRRGLGSMLKSELSRWWKTRMWWVQCLTWVGIIDLLLSAVLFSTPDAPPSEEVAVLFLVFAGLFRVSGSGHHHAGCCGRREEKRDGCLGAFQADHAPGIPPLTGDGPCARAGAPVPGGGPQRLAPLLSRRRPDRLRQQPGHDHSYVGVFDPARRKIAWIAPGVDRDSEPRWSADGKRIAFVRRPGPMFDAAAAGEFRARGPADLAIWVAEVATGKARELWRAPKEAPLFYAFRNFELAANDRILFTAER